MEVRTLSCNIATLTTNNNETAESCSNFCFLHILLSTFFSTYTTGTLNPLSKGSTSFICFNLRLILNSPLPHSSFGVIQVISFPVNFVNPSGAFNLVFFLTINIYLPASFETIHLQKSSGMQLYINLLSLPDIFFSF